MYRITNKKLFINSHKALTLITTLFLTIITAVLKIHLPAFAYIIPILFLWIYISLESSQPQISFVVTVISFITSYGLFAISSFLANLIIYLMYHSQSNYPFLKLAFLSAFLQLLLTYIVFNLKRFQKGMPFLAKIKTLNITTILCLFLILFLMHKPKERPNAWIEAITTFIFVMFIAFLIHWWQTQITKSYKQALNNRELESLRMELEEKEKQLAEVSTRNEELGRLIHKDNKRIPAMEHAVSEFLVMDMTDKEKTIERANALLIEIQKLSDDRNNTVTEIYARKYKHHNYGIAELDNMLNYMEKRAYGEHIKLSVQTAINFHDFVPKHISAEDLSHVLSDLLENAIIAAKHSSSPVIQLQFYKAGKDFVIEIADNGIPFEAASLVNFGLEQITTHADTGGSGIGLMDIWKNKEKYGASLHITEYKDDAPYAKKIALIFNKKNRYTISTERKEELLALSKRTDLQIF